MKIEYCHNEIKNNKLKKINIFSDFLIIDTYSKNIKFIGNVTLYCNNLFLESEELIIVPKNDTANNALYNFIALGNVNIKLENKIVISEYVIYSNSSKTLILKGNNSSIEYIDNIILSNKIIYFVYNNKISIKNGNIIKIEKYT